MVNLVKLFVAGIFIAACSAGSVAQTLSDALSDGEVLALSPGVSGQVAEVLVDPGELVKKGQLLLSLGDTTYKSRLEAVRATHAHAKFRLQLLEEDYARQEELYEEGSLSAVELQQLDLVVKQARMELAIARAAVDVAMANLAFTKIIAPADGEITAVPMVGQRVSINLGLPVLIKMSFGSPDE
ncbi:MAG: efflux RND transporter periplasmic adaptor subunit [Proteobacteria bacterium]|nr:efflux RND transporter periplasmic adaptor subunit [Pseudomonadota bacterium]